MRRTLPLVALGALAFLAACQDMDQPVTPEPAQAPLTPADISLRTQQVERVVPGRVLARLQDGADPAEVGNSHGLALGRVSRGYVAFRGAAGNERALAAQLRGDDRVVWAEPDYLRQPTQIDGRLWAFYNPGGLTIDYTRGRNKGQPVNAYASTNDADEDNSPENYASDASTAVAIASIDTGVDFNHEQFTTGNHATLVPGYDFYDNDSDPTDTEGHGTHTTGTMVGKSVGVAGVAGAAPKVTVYVFRVCGSIGCPTSAIIDAIRAATDEGVVAMNMSLGGGSESQGEADAIAYATSHDALVIASAGNDGTSTVSCPACDPNAISVSATNWQDGLSYYSNWGSGLDISAPGGEMYSNTTEESGIYSSVPGGYAYYQGTSMAAPQVTGTAAVVVAVNGPMSASSLRARILDNADDLGDAFHFGAGRLNTYAAVVGGGSPPPPPPPSNPLTASFSYNCHAADCSFDASSSTGANSYAWAFGDGGTGSGVTTSHTYTTEGNHNVVLTVGDGSSTDQTTQTIRCSVRGKNLRCN